MKQGTLKIKKKPDPIRFIKLEGWVARPGKFNIACNDYIEALRQIRAAGLHPMRVDVIERPSQGYGVTIVSGNYQTIEEAKADAQKPPEQTDLL